MTGDQQAQIQLLLQDEQQQIERIRAHTRACIAALLSGNQNAAPVTRSNAQQVAPPFMENAPHSDDVDSSQRDDAPQNDALIIDLPIARAW